MQKRLLTQTGVDPDGRRVYSGTFAFYETHGMPLDMLLALMWDREESVPDWQDLLASMVRAGRPFERACGSILSAIHDACYPLQVRDAIVSKFNLMVERWT